MTWQKPTYFQWLYLLIGLAVLVNFSALFVTIIGPDGTYYAGIAKTIVWRNDWVNLYVQGTDFLDKPHFPFWITALSFKLFGIKTWAYKLPGILFMLMGAAYTYKFAKRLYNKEVALWAVLILLTAQHIVISSNDVRAEPYLTGLIIASIYHFYRAYPRLNFTHLLGGSLLAACAVMTKGVFALIPIVGAIGGHLALTREWRQLFHWRWLLAAVLIGVFILPEIYCLYVQFDSHPEKLVFDQHGVSGVKWFLWDSQVGRFFNNGPIKGSGDPFFFVHTLLWAFLPWSLLLFVAIFRDAKQIIKGTRNGQWFCLCGAMLTFLVFSASKFQLPYYLNIVFPLYAIQLAAYLKSVRLPGSIKTMRITQGIVIGLMLLLIVALQFFFRPGELGFATGFLVTMFLVLLTRLAIAKEFQSVQKILLCTIAGSFVVNAYLNTAFYPSLLKYQSGSEAAFFINSHNHAKLPVAQTGEAYNFPLEFYLDQPLVTIDAAGIGPKPSGQFLLYGDSRTINGLRKKGWEIQSLKSFEHFWVSMLKPAFLNYKTRATEVTTAEVVLVRGVK